MSKILRVALILLYASATHAQNSAPIHPVDGEYITEWLVLGPFFPNNLEKDFLVEAGGEANIEPRAGDTVTIGDGRTVTWRSYRSKGNIIVDLLDAFGNLEHATAYAFCTLRNEVEGDVRIRLRHDNGTVVWINGQRVYSHSTYRELSYDEGVFEAKLKAGENRCLVKITQNVGPWGFAMRVLSRAQAAATMRPKFIVAAGILKNSTKSIGLTGNWKYHPSDDAAWADSEFDDSSWETADTWLNPDNLPQSGWTGIG